MKKRLKRRLFLFLISSILMSTSYSQALPDPGNDPLGIQDSIPQTVHQKTVPRDQTEKVTVINCPQQKDVNKEMDLTINIPEKKGEEESK